MRGFKTFKITSIQIRLRDGTLGDPRVIAAAKKERLNDLDGTTWGRYSISIWDIVKTPDEMKLKHPAIFPVELCRRLIKIYTKKGDLVIDPFVGSGNTLVACKELGRRGVGIDINEKFVKTAKKRLMGGRMER
jgi:DNA modification methylase